METPFSMPLRSCPLLAGLKPHVRDSNRGANGHRDGTVSSRQCSRVGINLSWLSSFDYIRTMELEQASWIWRNALAILLVKLVITESYIQCPWSSSDGTYCSRFYSLSTAPAIKGCACCQPF